MATARTLDLPRAAADDGAAGAPEDGAAAQVVALAYPDRIARLRPDGGAYHDPDIMHRILERAADRFPPRVRGRTARGLHVYRSTRPRFHPFSATTPIPTASQ